MKAKPRKPAKPKPARAWAVVAEDYRGVEVFYRCIDGEPRSDVVKWKDDFNQRARVMGRNPSARVVRVEIREVSR